MCHYLTWVKRLSFVVFVAAVSMGTTQETGAFWCWDILSYEPPSVYASQCGSYPSDPCTDGSALSECMFACQVFFSLPGNATLDSCDSFESEGWWNLTAAACSCLS